MERRLGAEEDDVFTKPGLDIISCEVFQLVLMIYKFIASKCNISSHGFPAQQVSWQKSVERCWTADDPRIV